MSILNAYQMVFILTLATVFALGYWVKVRVRGSASVPRIQPAEAIRSAIADLDRLFDSNLISVEEYVERRGTIIGRPGPA